MTSWQTLQQRQPIVVKMLTNSIKKDRLAHAYLFEGSAGTGKKDVAIQLAKSFFCTNRHHDEPCQTCLDCRRIDSGNHPDLHVIEPDGQSIKIDQIRTLQKEFAYLGMESNQKVYIVNHADRMTTQAANSLLKFLEEPGKQTIAILLTEQLHQMLPTIRSRCQILSFRPLSFEDMREQLQERSGTSDLLNIAASLTNDLTEAETLTGDDWFAEAQNIVVQFTEELFQRPHQALLTVQEKWLPHFQEKQQQDLALSMLLLWYKDVLLVKLNDEAKLVFQQEKASLEQVAFKLTEQKLRQSMEAILEAKKRLFANTNPQLVMEQLVLRLREG